MSGVDISKSYNRGSFAVIYRVPKNVEHRPALLVEHAFLGLRHNIAKAEVNKIHFVHVSRSNDWAVVEPAVGLEPTTYGLQNRCSTG